MFPVQTEQAITGTTTGIGGAQVDDGVLETLSEVDTAPDLVTPPSMQTVTTGTIVSGSFPADIAAEDDVFLQYREATGATESADIGYRSNTGTNAVSSPKTRTWDGSAWSAETEQGTAGSPIRGVRLAWSPVSSSERIFVTQSDDGRLDAYVCTTSCTMTGDIGQVWTIAPASPQKRFDVAYEQLSGEALLVYGVLSADNAQDLAFKTYVGGAWSVEQYVDDAGETNDVNYTSINLAPKSGSDAIGLIAGDNTNNDINAWIWDGGAFGSFAEITASTEPPVNQEKAVIAWESGSGHLIAVAVRAAVPDIGYREFTTTWSAPSTFTCGADNQEFLSLKPNPVATANDMVLALNDDAAGNVNVHTCYWSGTAWANWNTHDIAIDSATSRPFDFAWENSGSRGILVWGTTAGQITYRTFTAPNTWGAITNVAMGTNTHPWVGLRTNPGAGGTKVLGAVMESAALDLGAIQWDGTTLSVIGTDTFSGDVGTTTHESFELEYRQVNDADRLVVEYGWTGVPSGDSYALRVKGYRTDEDVHVQVLTPPSTWTTRLTVSATANALYTYPLTALEYNSGSPSLRFVDAGGVAGLSDLWVDGATITAVRLAYSLEVRQNVTGISAGSNPILVVKGNITAGGENFHVNAWNFTSAAWELLLAAPFTSVNAYHNASLGPDHVSAGTARVLFLDAGSQSASMWGLSLDFVAVAITNGAAMLTNAGVAPATGNITSSFTFFVRYVDAEGDAPATMTLTLDGATYAMAENDTADMNHADGKDYYFVRTIGVRGTFPFWFSTSAAAGDTSPASTATQSVSVGNRGPSITNPIAVDGVHTGRPYVRDFNGSDPDGDILSWSLGTNATWLSIGSTNGTAWGSAPSLPSSFVVNVTADDGYGGAASNAYVLSVGNLGPAISNPLSTATSSRRASFVHDFAATDPEGDALGWSLRTNASFLSIGASNGTVYGTTANIPVSYWVEATVSDGLGGQDSTNFTLIVVNAPPEIVATIPPTASVGDEYAGTFSGTDPDLDPLTWSMATNASWLAMDGPAGALYGTALEGSYYVNLSVRDGYGGTAWRNVTIVIGAGSTGPPGGPGDLGLPFSLLPLSFAVVGFAFFLVALPRRRPILDAAFLLDSEGAVRFEYAAPGGGFDQAQLRAILASEDWLGLELMEVPPHSLYFVVRGGGIWVLVSRSTDKTRVTKAAEPIFARAAADLVATGSGISPA